MTAAIGVSSRGRTWWDEDCLFIGPSQVIGDLCVEEEVQELQNFRQMFPSDPPSKCAWTASLLNSATPELLPLASNRNRARWVPRSPLRKPCLAVFPGRFALPAASSPDVDLAFGSGIGLSDVPGSAGVFNWEKGTFR